MEHMFQFSILSKGTGTLRGRIDVLEQANNVANKTSSRDFWGQLTTTQEVCKTNKQKVKFVNISIPK